MPKPTLKPPPLVPIPRADLAAQIGNLIHIAGLNPGCTWRLMSIDGEQMRCLTPKTQREAVFPACRALHSRRHEPGRPETEQCSRLVDLEAEAHDLAAESEAQHA